MNDFPWETAPAAAPLPAGFPSLATPTIPSIPFHAKRLRALESWLLEKKIHFSSGQKNWLPQIQQTIRDIHALRWELASDGVGGVPIMADDDKQLLTFHNGGEQSFA